VEITINHRKQIRAQVKTLEIIAHKFVHKPMQTRLKAVDNLVPIGRGQIN
jgi:F0F1-type ATP synthase alpha subunit